MIASRAGGALFRRVGELNLGRRKKWKLSKDLGLGLGHVTGRFFIGTEELHFGYWPEGLAPELKNLPRAQEAFSDLLIDHLPADAKSVLEVGCGTGELARRILDSGRSVEVVSPSSYLTQVAREKLGDRAQFHECRFEDLETDRRFDVVLFSESFQYLERGRGLAGAHALLNRGGHVLLCDYFRLPSEERSPIGGGRPLAEFEEDLKSSPFEVLTELDISERVAPGLAVLQHVDENLVRPGYEAVTTTLEREHPWILRFLRWKYRRKLKAFETRIASGARNPAAFLRHKSYRLYLLAPRA